MDIISEPSISEIIILLLSCMSKYLFSKKNLSHRLIYCPENSVAPFLVSSSCLKSSQLLVRLLFLCGQLFYLYSWWKDVLIILVIQTFCSAAAAKSRQLCPTLCDPIDGSPPGSHPWDSPGKNTGVGCHFLFQTICSSRCLFICIFLF